MPEKCAFTGEPMARWNHTTLDPLRRCAVLVPFVHITYSSWCRSDDSCIVVWVEVEESRRRRGGPARYVPRGVNMRCFLQTVVKYLLTGGERIDGGDGRLMTGSPSLEVEVMAAEKWDERPEAWPVAAVLFRNRENQE